MEIRVWTLSNPILSPHIPIDQYPNWSNAWTFLSSYFLKLNKEKYRISLILYYEVEDEDVEGNFKIQK